MPIFSMTETLFGGLLLATAVFFTCRSLGLSNFWSGILSGALPFLGFLAYNTQHWAGGDVLAIHFAVYLATAGVLMVFSSIRKKKEKMHWAPRLIIFFFVGLVILNAVLLSIASRGLPDYFAGMFLPNPDNQKVHTAFPGVMPHDRNKLYEPHLQQVEQQRNLGWKVVIHGLDNLERGKQAGISITVTDNSGQPVDAAVVTLGLWRMANSKDDRQLPLQEGQKGVYHTEIMLPDAGRWLTEILIQRGDQQYRKQQALFVDG
ncbi:MAG TPA: FixH family protein [Methylophilaceae bacterium]|nr:FixH family protein [Methylophilaceae bacterium]